MMMIEEKPVKEEQAEAKTWVIWDINNCPVPSECDAGRVGPCIRRSLKNLGYNGPVSITAIGMLTDLPVKLLQSVSSSGIDLFHTPSATAITDVLLYTTYGNPDLPPEINILVISPDEHSGALEALESEGYNVLPQVFRDCSPLATAAMSAHVESFWKSFLKEDTMDSEEEKCTETSDAELVCQECEVELVFDFSGKGFHNFINHFSREDHHELMLDYLLPSEHKSYLEKCKAFHDSYLKNAFPSVNKQPKASFNI